MKKPVFRRCDFPGCEATDAKRIDIPISWFRGDDVVLKCQHRIADARNPLVKSGYICIDCGSLFSAADHEAERVEPVAWLRAETTRPEYFGLGVCPANDPNGFPVYRIAPAAAVSEPANEREAFEQWWNSTGKFNSPRKENFFAAWLARAIEAAIRSK